MKPIKTFAAGLALAAGLAFAGTVPLEAQPSQEPFTPEQVLQYLSQNRRNVALASYTVAPTGRPDPSDPVVLHNADQPMPLASTIKIVLLAGYAREVAAGRLDPEETVTLADWERFYLPGTDGNAHPAALAWLGIPRDEYGFAVDPSRTVRLDTLVGAMIRFSDNAATDWLLERLGEATVRATMAEAGLKGQQMPQPILGIFLSWGNHENGPLTQPRLRQLLRLKPRAYAAHVRRLTAAYQDPEWRMAELLWRLEGGPNDNLQRQAQAGEALFPRGTARDYTRLLAGVITGTLFSEEASAIMRRHLEWPLEAFPELRENFESFGNKGGSLASVATDAYFFIARTGDFAGRPRVSALFMKGVPSGIYQPLADGAVLFNVGLAVDRDLAEQARRVLGRR